MSCTHYCGCATRSNRLKWSVFVVAALAGMAFLAAYMGVLSRCSEASRDLSDCKQSHEYSSEVYGGDPCHNQEVVLSSCLQDHVNSLFCLPIIAALCFIICMVPLYMMCCCTHPPNTASRGQEGYQAVELHTAAPVPQRPKKYRGPYPTSHDGYAPHEGNPPQPQQGAIAASPAVDAPLEAS